MTQTHICRKCKHIFEATDDEVLFGRVLCPVCLSTADPTPEELERIERRRASEERRRKLNEND